MLINVIINWPLGAGMCQCGGYLLSRHQCTCACAGVAGHWALVGTAVALAY